MSEFRIFETDRFQDDLERISPERKVKLERKLRESVYPQLRAQPYFGPNIKKLRSFDPETWRYRIGPYRFFYTIDDRERTVSMIAAGTRQAGY